MSKRSANWQGGEERYGGPAQPEEMADVPKQATAAQLAKRKIAQAKGSRRPRSESPLTNTGSIFEQANSNGMLGNNGMNPTNPFASNNSFTFGNGNSSQTQSFGSGGGSFTFGAASGQNTAQTTPNMNTSFTFGSSAPAPTTSFQFGQTPSSQTNGFGSGNTGFSFGQQNGDATPKANVFTIHEDQQTPKATNPFGAVQPPTNSFGTAPSTNGFNFTSSNAQPKPAEATSTPFSGFGSTTAATPAPAASASKPAGDGWSSFLNKPAETPKPATNGFTFGATSTNATQTNGDASTSSLFNGFGAQNKTPSFKFTAQPDDDASMMSPENTPQKPTSSGTFTQAESVPKITNTGSLFDRITKPAESSTAQPTPSFFSAPSATPAKENTQPSDPNPQENAQPSLFAPSAPTPGKDISQSSNSLFAKPAATASQGSLFASQPPAKVQLASSMPAPAAPQSTPAAKKTTSMATTKPQNFDSIRELNEGLLQHLQTQDLSRDLSTIFEFYAQEIKKITTIQPASNGFGSSILGRPTSQSNASGVADTVTAKPSEPLYPKLPDTASSTAKIFEAALDAPAAGSAGTSSFGAKPQTTSSASSLFAAQSSDKSATPASSLFAKPSAAPSTSSLFAPKPANGASSSSSLFAPKSASETPQASSLFAPKPAAAQDKPAGFTPSVSMGFTPTVKAGGSFTSSFGEQAEKNAAAEKKRRRDEDFDSDEDNEADWEKRDAEEQAAKRSKIQEAAKNATGFTFKPTTTSTPAANSLFNFTPAEAKKDEPAAPPVEDHTWKQGTPIKFGANSTDTSSTPAPKFNLFSAATPGTGTSLFANMAKPANTFTFGQASATPAADSATKPASAPAAGNDSGEATNAEAGDAEPPMTQLDDLAVLLPSELEESDILYQVDKSKSKKLESRPSEGGTEKLTWVDKGHGPIWILKNKSNGKTRVLQKVKDSGRVAMNFGLLPGNENYYKHEGMASGKAAKATFIDHLAKNTGPSQWMILVGQKDDAAQIARILRDEQSKL